MSGVISSYHDAEEFLSSLSTFGIKLGLDTIRELCKSASDPQKAFRSVLVAGTNGKGSVCAYLSTMLQHAGYKTGLYISPHLVDLRERVMIDGMFIPENRFTFFINELRQVADDLFSRKVLEQYPTYFEFITAAAFLWFREEKVDIAVMEIGLGGRFDAVNITDPVLSVITEIDYDHQKHLGRTLTAIAGEKAGIMRTGKPVVLSVSKSRPLSVLKKIAAEKKAEVFEACKDIKIKVDEILPMNAKTVSGMPVNPVRRRMEENIDSMEVISPTNRYQNIIPALPGRHQLSNISAAVYAAERLNGLGFSIKNSDIIFGIENAKWRGRLEWVDWKKPLLLDGGHNPAGLRSLTDYIQSKLASKRFNLVFACKTSKDYKKMCEILFPLAGKICLPKVDGYQFVDPALLGDEALKLNKEVVITVGLKEAFAEVSAANDTEFVLAAGSLHLVGEVIMYLNE